MRSDCSFVRAANGLRFAYVEQGERDGAPVLMLHGYTDTHRSFDLLRPHLPETWRAIALTQRGHGRSDKPQNGYALERMADDAAAFLDALGLERAVLVGHSMGAAVATYFAAAHPDRVDGLALIGAFAGFEDKAPVAELAAEVARFGDGVDGEFVLAFQESTIAYMIPQRFLDVVISESLRCPAHVWKAVLQSLLPADILGAALACDAPAILMRGEHDGFVPEEDQIALRDALGSAYMFTLPDVGHAPHWEAPEAVAGLLCDFVERVGKSADRTTTRTQPVTAASFRT